MLVEVRPLGPEVAMREGRRSGGDGEGHDLGRAVVRGHVAQPLRGVDTDVLGPEDGFGQGDELLMDDDPGERDRGEGELDDPADSSPV
jgi:hypothetical protein